MIGVMSLWSRPHLEKFGAYSERFMMLWAYSLAEAKRVFERVVLITDAPGAEIMKELPYDDVIVLLEDRFLPPESEWVWSAGKEMAYLWAANNGKEFCHFDGDFIIRKWLSVFGADVFAQSDEKFLWPPEKSWEETPRDYILAGVYLHNECGTLPYMPDYLRLSLTRNLHIPYNTGIFGGRDMDFIGEYAEESLRILRHPANLGHWGKIASICSACFTEQYLLGSLAQHKKKYVAVLFPDIASHCDDFMTAIGITHLLGDAKRDEEIMAAVYEVMRVRHGSYYEAVKRMSLTTITPYVGRKWEWASPY